ncbi:hypothetical protein HPB48_000915 [Haemaphysalis longicornis]|uniref:Uncharacterized protein n=1 Tax=Haemaphysalis longicornis TaxID=44386 RepID=A0A9J6GVU9_HAELO|nr:hypothetical protein HPB48_000915 [Haemaphysalis longicornis]
MVVPVTLINDIKAAVDLSNQANVEDGKKQFANAIRLYRKSYGVVPERRAAYPQHGIDGAKLVLTQIITDPKAKAASTILLHGPHGTGKSLLMKSLYVKYPEKSIFIVDLDLFVIGGLTHDAAKMTKMLPRGRCRQVRAAGVPGRGGRPKKEYREIIIATANRPWLIEEGMKGAFDARHPHPDPGDRGGPRLAIIKEEMGKLRCPTYKDGDMEDLAKKTARFSRYQLQRIVRYALARNFHNLEGREDEGGRREVQSPEQARQWTPWRPSSRLT